MTAFRLSPFVLLAILAAALAQDARADTTACTQVTSLPFDVTEQGVYCLKSSLSANSAIYSLVHIKANNVTLDCNGHAISQLGGGAIVILVGDQQNVTIRNCTLKGAQTGMSLVGAGHLVEDNTIMGAAAQGIYANGDDMMLRGNRVLATGGRSTTMHPAGISVSGKADVLDNTIAGVSAWPGTGHGSTGVRVGSNPDGDISGNRVSGLASDGVGLAVGISATQSPLLSVRDNVVIGDGTGMGIRCSSLDTAMATGNRLLDLATAVFQCRQDDNLVAP